VRSAKEKKREREREKELFDHQFAHILKVMQGTKRKIHIHKRQRERERDELNNIVERSLSSLVIDVNEIREKKNTATQIGHTSIGHWSFNVRTNYTLCVCAYERS